MALSLVEQLTSGLGLSTPPIAAAFVEGPPEGVERFEGETPSACSFWRRAETGTFYAPADRHLNCPVGAMVMGIALPPETEQNLMSVVQLMIGCGYLAAEEADRIPTVSQPKAGILYGPLAEFPADPDIVLLWLNPRQAMLFTEVAGTCHWTESAPMPALGRPACAAIPRAMDQAQPTLSLGCMGMRTFTEISEDRLLGVLPGKAVGPFAESLADLLSANETMREFYEGHKALFRSPSPSRERLPRA